MQRGFCTDRHTPISPSSVMKLQFLQLFLTVFATAEKIPDFVVPGKCPNVDEDKLWQEQKPNHSKFGGVWYEFSLINNPYQLIDKCVRNEFKFDGQQFEVTETGLTAEGHLLKRKGTMYPSTFGEPHWTMDMENAAAGPVVILETDYDNYACLYTCLDVRYGYEVEFAFIMSRSPTPAEEYVWRCEKVFKDLDVDASSFKKTIQGSSCPYDTQKSL
ncbi:crustacyanin-C1 subunit-like [Panulirus ornatus]|uniref:crustacyanin-C1 subunit-like n=1 Tax=Panulirus ornatus TaxID=150431 RepID=UPI003A8541B5